MWTAYRELRGPLNLGMRMEQLMAMSDFRRHVSRGGKEGYDKFVRFHAPVESEEVTLEDIAKKFGRPYEVRSHGK